MRLSNAVAIITGGSSGFGKEFAKRICSRGGRVLLSDINEQEGVATAASLQQEFGVHCAAFRLHNVTEMDGFELLFDACQVLFKQPANLMINNAGISGDGTFYDNTVPKVWTAIVDIDLTAVIRGTQVALNRMKATGGGVIINISSAAGLAPVQVVPVYAAAKWGVVGFSRSCAQVARQNNIRINVLCPSFADSAMGRTALLIPEIKEHIDAVGGLMPISLVTDAMEQLVENENANGKVMSVLPHGSKDHKFSRL